MTTLLMEERLAQTSRIPLMIRWGGRDDNPKRRRRGRRGGRRRRRRNERVQANGNLSSRRNPAIQHISLSKRESPETPNLANEQVTQAKPVRGQGTGGDR